MKVITMSIGVNGYVDKLILDRETTFSFGSNLDMM